MQVTSGESGSESGSASESESESDSEEDMTIAGVRDALGLGKGKGGYSPSLSDIVEVYWVGEGTWFEGEVIGTRRGGEYRVYYRVDGQKLWHDSSERVRLKL